MALTDKQVLAITSAAVLLAGACHVLSDFELELVADISRRFLRHGREAEITDLEWPAFEDALAAMRAELRRQQIARGSCAAIAARHSASALSFTEGL